jgi:hypothetical protein
MARFASNKNALGISDRSGAAYRLKNMRKEWTGMLVGKDEWESKHPQLMVVSHKADPQALQDPRPDRTEPPVEVLLPFNPFRSVVRFRSCEAFDGFTEDTLEYSSGYSITVVDTDTYTFSVSGETASTGFVQGGGGTASSGPVTVSA